MKKIHYFGISVLSNYASIYLVEFLTYKYTVTYVLFFSATEFREWLLHFSVPVLEGVLPQENLIHYMLLVSALNLLNQDGVCQEDINYADRLLQDFCKLYPQLYGMNMYDYCITSMLQL